MSEEIPLNYPERKKMIGILKGIPFANIVLSDYLRSQDGIFRHRVNEEILKNIYSQFDKIIDVTVRDGNKHCFIYRMSDKLSYYLIFRLDKKPKELFNAYDYHGDVRKRMRKKYMGF